MNDNDNDNSKIYHKTIRQDYNHLVADETIEDYSLRYTPASFRKFSELLIANTAIGSISFLALEAIGASIAISYGFTTAFYAILSASVIIFLTAVPISYHAAKYNIDIDLITRSAGFGYVGSTITSLIYASFSFIFFAIEAAIMAQALELYFGLPLAWGYLVSSLVVIPIVFYGITLINKLQLWTQPIWIVMMITPFVAVLVKEPEAITTFLNFSGTISGSSEFNIYYFGFALGISLSLIAQVGEQADYLRFMPPLTKKNRFKWWFSVLLAGPGWIILGFLKQIGGIFLAGLVLLGGLSLAEAKTPIQMYYMGYQYVFDNPEVALSAAIFFVVISQIKINVTNAYAGSLAWSNFFSRVTHSHPGRVVWMIFNIAIALLLMELGLFEALDKVLGLYSNVAIAWIGSITADLIINKPLGLSPKIIEFKRAYLYNINPVGIGSMTIASFFAILSFVGLFGDIAQSYSSVIAVLLSFTLSPVIAYLTKGKYYIARTDKLKESQETKYYCNTCGKEYEKEDMAYCPVSNINICSLCCSLNSLCHDSCKSSSEKTLRQKTGEFMSKLSLSKISSKASLRVMDFVVFTSLFLFIILIATWMVYSYEIETVSNEAIVYIKESFKTLFFIMAILVGILVWWILLAHENRKRAEDELEEQYKKLQVSKQALLDQKNLYELVFKNTSSGILILDIDKDVVIDCNEAAVHILKYKSKAAILNHRPSEFSPEYQPDGKLSHDKVKEVIQIVKDKGYNSFEWKHLTSENKEVWIDVTLTSIELDGQKVLHTVWKDIDERKALQLKDAHQAQIIQQTNDSVISVDLDGNILTWNGGSEELFEYTADEAIGKNISMTYKKEDIYKLFKSFDMLISTGEYSADLSLVKKSHKLFDASVSLSLLKDEQGEPIAIVGYTQDITLRKETEKILEEQRKTLEYQAHYDALTGLPNRMLFQDRLLQGMEKSKRHSTQLALFFIDLDRFKQINDSLGHEVGDKVLQEVALRLKKTTRDEDSIARLGGDEFTIVMEDLARGENASVLARKILNTLSEALYIDEHTLYVSCSIGISLFPQDSTDSGKLIMYADAAMYKAKDEGKNNFQFYSSDMTNLAMKKVTLEVGLRKAIKNEEFIVYYQAQVDAVSGRTTGMEALVRWNHPDDGLISPALFIPIAEETGLIIELDQWVMKTAMNQFSSWYAQGLTPGVLAMNLSIKQLQKKGFISMFKGLMEETKCKAEWIELEVTESQIMTHPEDAIKILTKISELGIELAVDDFGTGYSSLSYLKKLPINKLKIDQTFVRGLPDDEEDAGITKAVIALAKSLSLRIIAEGVETKEQKDFLVENGCKSIQGYFYSKPIPAQEIDLMSIE